MDEIGDLVWCDRNNNGIQDPDETGEPSVRVNLHSGNKLIQSQFTNGQGGYLFKGIPTGADCTVSIDSTTIPEQMIPADNCPENYEVNLEPGASFRDADFCLKLKTTQIGNFVWCDLDDDGEQDEGEPGIEGVKVVLNCWTTEGTMFSTFQTTGVDGSYLFTGVPAGTCEISVDLSTVSPDKHPGKCPSSIEIQVAPGEAYLDADFCFVTTSELGSLTGRVWKDSNCDKNFQESDYVMKNVTATLYNTEREPIGSTMIDELGVYHFSDAPAGSYIITVAADPTFEKHEVIPVRDPDDVFGNIQTPHEAVVMVSSGQHVENLNFVYIFYRVANRCNDLHSKFTDAELNDPNLESSLWGNSADPDLDGQSNLLEYAVGGNPLDGSDAEVGIQTETITIDGQLYLCLSFKQRTNDPGIVYVPEVSDDGINWHSAGDAVEIIEITNIDDSFDRVKCIATAPLEPGVPCYCRLRIVIADE